MAIDITVRGVGITLSLLLWRHGRARGQTAARLSQTLRLNPGLAALGPEIPVGTRVRIPDLEPVSQRTRPVVPAVSLFD